MSNFNDLQVFQLAKQLACKIYEVTAEFPSDEKFGLTAQLRRAAVSVVANIAEGTGRRTDGYFAHFLRIAIGSAYEIEALLGLAVDLKIVEQKSIAEVQQLEKNVAIKLQNLVASLNSGQVREEVAMYGFDSELADLVALEKENLLVDGVQN